MEQTLQKDTLSTKDKLTKALNSKPRRNQFLISLYNALEKKQYEDAMCWDTDGIAIMLKKPAFIEDTILMEQFSGMKFTSFIRQLSYYGFKRVSRRAKVKVYCHEQFSRDRKDHLKQIKRKHKDSEISKIVVKNTMTPKKEQQTAEIVEAMQKKINNLQAELEKLRTENLALRSCARNLRYQNDNRIEEEQARASQDLFSKMNNENNSTGPYQMFFNPQIGKNLYTYTNQNGDELPCLPNQADFMTIYQPDCKIHQPSFSEKLLSERTDSHQIDPQISDTSEFNFEESDFFKPIEKENAQESFWKFEDFIGSDF